MRSCINPTQLPPGENLVSGRLSPKNLAGWMLCTGVLLANGLQGELFSGCWIELPPTLALPSSRHDCLRSRRALIFDTWNAETKGSLKTTMQCDTKTLFAVALKSCNTYGWCRTHFRGFPGGSGTLSFSHNINNVV